MIKKNKKKAFSLIELSMVITVVAILIGVVIIAASGTGGYNIIANSKITAARGISASSPVRDIANLELWLDATAKDSFKNSEITSTTKAISVWYDVNKQSNYQNNATQGTAANQPIYVPNVTNGLPGVFFDATNDGMVIDTTLDITGNYTIFIVFSGSSSTGRSLQSDSGAINWLIGSWSSKVAHYAEGWIYNSTNITPGKLYITDAVRKNSGSTFYINGSAVASGVSYNTAPRNLALSASGNFNEPMNGYIFEIIVFTRDLDDSERQDVENYLSDKWKITLSRTNPASCSSAPDSAQLVNGTWSSSPTPPIASGNSVSGSCNSGYAGSNITALCNNGSYSYYNNSCTSTSCTGNPSAISNGSWSCGTVANGSSCSGSCNSGYTGSPTALCNNGSYATPTGSCTPLGCGAPSDNPYYAAVNLCPWSWSQQSAANGQTIYASCPYGCHQDNTKPAPQATCNLGVYTYSGLCIYF